MKKDEIKGKTKGELETLLSEKREAVRLFRFGTAGSRSKNIREARGLRRGVAKILTNLHNKNNK